jgi:predicted enzyme related to lactoylglutathione lyase
MPKGEITHVEFPADDVERATRFWSAVAGWSFSEPEGFSGYQMFRTGERSGGAIARRGEMAPQHLRLYVSVDSLEEACAAAEANGGTVVEQPTEIGQGMGRFAVVRDTEGSEVGLWQESVG